MSRLVGERGVGKTTIIAEQRGETAGGGIPFLAKARFLLIDARFIPPEESRHQFVAILEHLAERSEIVACFDGFAALLRDERGARHKAVVLSRLAHARCRLIGLMTPPPV